MSTLISRELPVNYDNVKTYLTANSGMTLAKTILFLGNLACAMKGTTECSAYINDTGMAELYPNATAHPVKADILMRCMSYRSIFAAGKTYINFRVGGTSVLNGTSSESSYVDYTVSGSAAAAITNSTRGSNLTFCLQGDSSSTQGVMLRGSVTLYFYQYDFRATAGTAVSSVSVSSATGFDGDSITYSCALQDGAAFVGWYNGSTLISTEQTYIHTVNGTDLTLTAVARVVVKSILTVSYGTQQLIQEEIDEGSVAVSYNGGVIAQVETGSVKTLLCSGRLMAGAVTINGHSLKCGGKVMEQNIIVSNERGS